MLEDSSNIDKKDWGDREKYLSNSTNAKLIPSIKSYVLSFLIFQIFVILILP